MIFGRSPNIVLGFLTAMFNVAVVFHPLGFTPDGTQIAAVNTAFGALVMLVANTASIQIAAGKAAASRSSTPS